MRYLAASVALLLFTWPSLNAQPLTQNRFVYPEYSKTISMDFQNAPLNDVLKIFSQQSGLNFVTADEVVDKQITLFLDNVPVEEALERILRANNLTYEIEPASNIFVVKPLSAPVEELVTRVYPLKHATVQSSKLKQTIAIDDAAASTTSVTGTTAGATTGITDAVKGVLSKSGSIIEDPRTNSLIVTDIPSQIPTIEQVIRRLDIPVAQILIVVEMLDISKKTADLMGIKIGDSPLSFSGGKRDHYYPWDQNELLRKGLVATDPAYTVGTISAAGLTALLQFLRTQTDTKNLARPRILTLNNETAQIQITTQEAIGLTTQTQSAQNTATQSLTAERTETGISLTVTPQADIASGNIIMAIAPKVSEARTGGTFSGQTFKDPEVRGTKSILRVHDGDTIVLGGLLRTDASNTITKIPLLGDIPLIGGAFRHKNKSDTERELIIFITPHIVPDSASSNLAFKGPRGSGRKKDIPPSRLYRIQKTLMTLENQQK